MNKILVVLLSLASVTCQMKGTKMFGYDESADAKYLWLEEIDGTKALEFAVSENKKTIEHLQKNSRYSQLQADIRKIILNKEKLTNVSLRKGLLYNYWQDDKNPKGLLRRTTIASYQTAKPQWEVLFDLDALAKKENENWVWQRSQDLMPNRDRTIIALSRGGKDAGVRREYDWVKKDFVKEGFNLPESKSGISWIDQDHVFVGTDFGPNTLTTSGYPRQVRIWKRGEDYRKAKIVFESPLTDMAAYGFTFFDNGKNWMFIRRNKDFYHSESFYVDNEHKLTRIPVPDSVHLEGFYNGFVILEAQKDFGNFKPGTVLSLPLQAILEKGEKAISDLAVIFAPNDKVFVEDISSSDSDFFLTVADNILRQVQRVTFDPEKGWVQKVVTPAEEGSYFLESLDDSSHKATLLKTDFLTPPTQILLDEKGSLLKLKSAPASFQTSDLQYTRQEARSADGTMIPYWIVSKKALKKDGKNPTVLYGYGGFLVSMSPSYRGIMGKAWLEKGGVYVLSHLRGGGEFGPKWHESVLKENRPKVFEDFIAIAEDLIQQKITSPEHLGIWGGSNGGLLVGATMAKRPDLFNAVICEVPLLDMLRYHKLLAGASWMAEYGNPEDPKMRDVILQYSPFQKIQPGIKYPEIFVMTSTKDDRVHPGHARKMVAKMKDQGHPVFYFENTDGGHGRTSNPESEVLWHTMQWTYFWEKLGGK